MEKSRRKNIFYVFALAAFAVLPSLISGTIFYYLYRHQVIDYSSGQGAILFFSVSALTMAFALTPTTFIAIISGYFFSWNGLAGLVAAYVAASVLGVFLGKALERMGVKLDSEKNTRLATLLKNLDNKQFLFVAFARLSPVLPFAMTNIALSSLKIKWKEYILGSLIGMLPRTVVFFWAGKNAKDIWSFAVHPSLSGFYKLAPLLLVLISTIGLLRIIGKNSQQKTEQ